LNIVNKKIGSFFLLPAHGRAGARATINNSPSPSEKILAKPKSRRAKIGGELEGRKIFARLLSRKAGLGVGSVSAILR
jgi:hypothetical protein